MADDEKNEVTVRLPKELHDQLKLIARQDQISVEEIIRIAIRYFLNSEFLYLLSEYRKAPKRAGRIS